MKIAIDISPLQKSSGHNVRGVGFYLQNLKEAITRTDKENTYFFFTDTKELPKDIELIHYPYFEPFFITRPLMKKIPTVVTIHDLTPILFSEHFPPGLKGKVKWEMNKYLIRDVDAIITDSLSSKNDCVRKLAVPEKRVYPVYLAANSIYQPKKINEKVKKELCDKYHLPENFALYVGDATWNKNLPRLLEAAIEAEQHLVLVGKKIAEENVVNHPWNKDLLTARSLIRSSEFLHAIGFVPDEDLVTLYNLAYVACFPSLYEGFGLPIVEAMQAGCPVIASREGSIPEVGGEAVYYVDAYSSNDIANALKEVKKDKSLQHTLREEGLKQAKNFSWDKTARETIAVYRKVLS